METVADALVNALVEAGVEAVFGLPGGEVVSVLDGLRRNNLRFIFTHNESSAVFMADATARITGKPSVCLTTLGPGATNAIAGVAHAWLDRAPVLTITAQMPDHLQNHHTHQLIDLHKLYEPITKGTFALHTAGAAETLRAALELATQGRPGPVHLQIDKETAEALCQPGTPPAGLLTALNSHALTPLNADGVADRIAKASHQLALAKRPLIITGLGLEPERPYTTLQLLAEALQAPVVTTPKGKGALGDDHPLSAGTVGLTRTDPIYEVIDEADCIIAVGFDIVELVKPWDQAVPLIWLAPWPNDDAAIPAKVEFVGPMTPILQQLVDTAVTPHPNWGVNRVAAFRHMLRQQHLPDPVAERMLPQAVLKAVRENVPPEASVAVDVGSHKILGSLSWPTLVPNTFFVSNGLSCMGFALPAMIAAALANPAQPAVCFIGDAGLAMVLGELAILAEYQLPVIVVVFHDAAIDLIRSHQVRAGYPVFGTEFMAPNFTLLAAAYQLDSYRVITAEECASAVQAAVTSGRPTVIEAMIDPISYPTTPKS